MFRGWALVRENTLRFLINGLLNESKSNDNLSVYSPFDRRQRTISYGETLSLGEIKIFLSEGKTF